LFRPLEEIPPAFERENGTPQTIHPYRHDWGIRLPRDQLVTTLQPQEHARPRELAFRENADDLATPNGVPCRPDRLLRLPRRNREGADRLEDRIQKADAVNLRIDNEPDRPWTRELQHDRIDPAEMIREKQKTAARKLLRAVRGDAINPTRERVADATDEAFGGRKSG
jgi:hypothetical protein